MKDLVMPKLLKVIEVTEPNSKNRVHTKVHMLAMDADHFLRVINSFNYGEISALEVRVGSSTKHPDDTHDHELGQRLAESRYKKILSPILAVASSTGTIVMTTEHYIVTYQRHDHSLTVSLSCY